MIGIDITKISRFKGKETQFSKKILSPIEQKEFKDIQDPTKYIATRWAIKEALYKADNSMSSFSRITIMKENGRYMIKGFQISTSTEGDLLTAIVIKEK